MTKTATPTKLRDGSWGARTAPGVKVGDVVTITTKSGKSWQGLRARHVDRLLVRLAHRRRRGPDP